MTVEEIRTCLESGASIPERPFDILKGLSSLLNSGKEDLCRNLVLHALEHRTSFGVYQNVLNALVRELGLFPYLDGDELSLTDSIAYEYHRPIEHDEAIVFHREQALIYRRLLAGDNIILSAPTSFGKSKVIDALITSKRYQNIVIIVPTLALIDETRRRLSRFSPVYKIVTQLSQLPATKNIFVFTAERANAYSRFPHIDFFAIDEFYKIGAIAADQKRTIALNQAFYNLSKGGGQFYLLGPCVNQIPEGFEARFECRFVKTTFATVAAQEITVSRSSNDFDDLCSLVNSLKGEPTLIFCKSPSRVNEVCKALLETERMRSTEMDAAADWMEENFHKDWTLPRALRNGIGMHHGKLPRSLAQFVVRSFNADKINTLVCTSTLIEGVNTKAKNVVIFDNKIAKEKFDFFTFNNIKGRSGRMFHHFVGRVFLFHEPPTDPLPFVDFPVFTQTETAPESILVHLDEGDLSPESKSRIEYIVQQTDLPIEILKKHSNLEPSNLLNLANALKILPQKEINTLNWNTFPNAERLGLVCKLSWENLIERSHAGVHSWKQLARNIWNLKFNESVRDRILNELIPGEFAAADADQAIERIFEFDRTWASFELPRILRAFSDVRSHVHGGDGDYSYFASQVENQFRLPFQIALEEFGIPIQISKKISGVLHGAGTIDDALERIRESKFENMHLSQFEQELLADCREDL